jgi:NADH-quinone oxidoreductase subunit L
MVNAAAESSFFLSYIWLIPLFPLCGAALMLLFGRTLDPQPAWGHDAHGHGGHGEHHGGGGKKLISLICPGMIGIAFLFSLLAVLDLAKLAPEERSAEVILFQWIAGSGVFKAPMGFLLDPLSSVMILVVTGIGFLIHVYSVGYMAHDGGYYRFFGYLNLFVFFMLMLVLADNYVLLFVGWEGVGLCSYLLIGFYFLKKSASDAANKAFLVNRIGDAAFVLGMLTLFAALGTVQFTQVNDILKHHKYAEAATQWFPWIALLLFIGATGKSAQIPLYVWLPDAMEGPTPVSALIHAATMVTAGVYMVARSSALYVLAPQVMGVVAIIGATTAIFAASIGLVQNDIKRVLAYSTVSQLGYMFLACGVGAFWVGIFHLYTHAFFKALLFLGSGSVIHACSGEQDMRKMGALKDKIPVTFRTMFIGSLAIAGIPGLAGFFSKDEILWQTWSSQEGAHRFLYVIGIITASFTAFYMWRLMNLTFYGKSRVAHDVEHHIHESPKSMTVPLMVLAAGSILAGWVGVPKVFHFPENWPSLERWLEPAVVVAAEGAAGGNAAEEHGSTAAEWGLMGLSVALALGGIWLARRNYHEKPEIADQWEAKLKPIHTLLYNKYYVDEIYNAVIVEGLVKGGGTVLSRFDATVVDGGVNGAGWLTRFTSRLSIWWDTWIIDGSVRLTAFLVKLASYPVRILQTGLVQGYALFMVVGVILIFGYYLWG